MGASETSFGGEYRHTFVIFYIILHIVEYYCILLFIYFEQAITTYDISTATTCKGGTINTKLKTHKIQLYHSLLS